MLLWLQLRYNLMNDLEYRKYARIHVIFIHDNINAIINTKYIFPHVVEYLSFRKEERH